MKIELRTIIKGITKFKNIYGFPLKITKLAAILKK